MIKKQKYIMVNHGDRSLDPFPIFLPKHPNKKFIENINVKKEDCVYKRAKYPQELKILEAKVENKLHREEERSNGKNKYSDQRFILEMWKVLSANVGKYIESWRFIREEQYKLRYGQWIVIHETITWVTPWHYRFLNYWTIDDVPEVEYRHSDWEFFIFADWLYRIHRDEYNNLVYSNDPDSSLSRLLLGYARPKHRRAGDTNKALNIGYSILMEAGAKKVFGIQSYDETNAREHYTKKLIPSFEEMPFFTKPMWGVLGRMPAKELKFNRPMGMGVGRVLNSAINFRASGEKAYDGEKLAVYFSDESGKTITADINVRHGIVKHTMAQGKGKKMGGYAMYPSTVEDLEAMGGANYQKLTNNSMFNGVDRTDSWLVTYFKTAAHGLEGFIDKFGYSIVDDPTEADLWKIPSPDRDKKGKLRGARRYLLEESKEKLSSNDPDKVAEGTADQQKYPIEYSDCWGGISGDAGFDMETLKKNHSDLTSSELIDEKETRRGKFYWVIEGKEYSSEEFVKENLHMMKGITDEAKVIWKDDEEGNFNLSAFPVNNNQRQKVDGIWHPTYPDLYTHSCDPYKTLNKVQKKALGKNSGGMSKGGMASFMERDPSVDKLTTDISKWQTYRFVADYLWRYSTTEPLFEDFIMLGVYFGGMLFPETNTDGIIEYIERRGFGGYLLIGNKVTGELNKHYGFHTGTETKQEMFSLARSYIKMHGLRNKHIDIAADLIALKGFDDLTNRDLTAAVMGCLLGSKSRHREYMNEGRKETVIQEDILPTFSF